MCMRNIWKQGNYSPNSHISRESPKLRAAFPPFTYPLSPYSSCTSTFTARRSRARDDSGLQGQNRGLLVSLPTSLVSIPFSRESRRRNILPRGVPTSFFLVLDRLAPGTYSNFPCRIARDSSYSIPPPLFSSHPHGPGERYLKASRESISKTFAYIRDANISACEKSDINSKREEFLSDIGAISIPDFLRKFSKSGGVTALRKTRQLRKRRHRRMYYR